MLSNSPPAHLYSSEQSRALDLFTIDELNISALTLMTRAGEAAMRCLQRNWRSARNIGLVCGGGNNAGDGYVLARLLQQKGYLVTVVQVGSTGYLSETAQACYQAMRDVGIEPISELAELDNAELIVDAIFGVGLSRDVEGLYAEAIEHINRLECEVLSLDVPSGLNASTGQAMGTAVKATRTITFMTAKVGLFTAFGPDYAGQVFVDDLETPSAAYEEVTATAHALTHKKVKNLLSVRARTGHKGTHGHAVIIGGAVGYRGALLLAAEAAARAGAGLVTMLGYASGPELFSVQRPELMYRGIEQPHEMRPLLSRASTVAIGPGLGVDDAAYGRFSSVLETSLPLVVDADALRLLAAETMKRNNWVLTPHPGEAALLLDCSVADVQADRLAAAGEISNRYGGACILKGAGSIIVTNTGTEVLLHGNPGMGSGGMGDVLTGVIGGLLAQGLSIWDAARLGACIHGRAGDRAAMEGERGLLACDLMPHIRRLVN
ncbi:MAG: NAD(P)H-hydrate dehydratase [Gammaproteobacteria bacterium]